MGNWEQWEFASVSIEVGTDINVGLNEVGKEGWEPWAILGQAQLPSGQNVLQIGIKRHPRKISMSTDIQGALIK